MNSMQLNIINSLVLAGDCITVAIMAAEIGLSVRQLQASVAHHFGITPLELLRETRLRMVREELIAADPDACTVSSIAYSLGFNHLGRFSHHYCIQFGGEPSETFRSSLHV